jgi:hypothetical protein
LEEMKATFFEEMSPAIEWNELARKICRRNEENKLNNEQVLDDIDETEDDYDEDDESQDLLDIEKASTKKPLPSTKAPKEKPTAKPKATSSVPPSIVDSNNENDESEADEDYYNEDEDEDSEDESIAEKPDKNILLDGIQVIKKVENRIFGELLLLLLISWTSAHSFTLFLF